MPVAPPLIVEAPPVESPRFGLFSIATMPEDDDQHWQNGVKWEQLAPCTPANAYGAQCEEPSGVPLSVREGQDIVEALPFVVYGSYRCKTFSKPMSVAEARALEHLLAWEERLVERAIMRGDLGNTPNFQGATVLDAGPVSPACALDKLEEFLATNVPGVGAIHIPRALAGTFSSQGAGFYHREGQHLETATGTFVALGGGYDIENVSPTGAAHGADARWVYATARPSIRRSDVFFTPSESNRVNTGNNDLTVLAHRVFVVGWDCEVAAVQVAQDCS